MTEREQQQIASMDRAIGRIEGKLDSLVEEIRANALRASAIEVANNARLDKLEGRMRAVENKVHWWSGAAAAIGAVVGYVGSHLKV